MKTKLRETQMLFKKTTNEAIRKEMGGLIINPNCFIKVAFLCERYYVQPPKSKRLLFAQVRSGVLFLRIETGEIRDIVCGY